MTAPSTVQDEQLEFHRIILPALLAAPPQAFAVRSLASLVDRSQGLRAAAIGQAIRDSRALAVLVELVDVADTQIDALRVIGNLASEDVDAQADLTRRRLRELKLLERVLPKIGATGPVSYKHNITNRIEPMLLIYALGTLRNACSDRDDALYMPKVVSLVGRK